MQNINTAQYWNDIYKTEKSWRKYPKTFKLVEAFAGTNNRILDLGCGPGILTNILRKKNNFVVGIDISPEACRMTGEPCVNAKIPPIQLRKYDWDIVVATEFLEHLDDPEEMIKESRRAAPKAIFTVPNNTLGPEECKEHTTKFDIDTITGLFKKYYDDVMVIEYTDRFDRIILPCLLIIAESRSSNTKEAAKDAKKR